MKETSMIRSIYTLGLLSLISFSAYADPAKRLTPGINDWNGHIAKLQQAGEETAPDALEATGHALFISSAQMAVAPGKSYKLSGEFRCAEGTSPRNIFFGLALYDAEGALIKPEYVFARKDTETQLVETAGKNSKSIKIRNASNWKSGKIYLAAFNIDPDGKQADLPNRKLSPSIEKITIQEDGALLEFSAPLNESYPAGTPVRMHLMGAPYLYLAANNKPITTDWQQFSAIIRGDRLWSGTTKIAIVMILNYGSANAVTQWKDITLEEI